MHTFSRYFIRCYNNRGKPTRRKTTDFQIQHGVCTNMESDVFKSRLFATFVYSTIIYIVVEKVDSSRLSTRRMLFKQYCCKTYNDYYRTTDCLSGHYYCDVNFRWNLNGQYAKKTVLRCCLVWVKFFKRRIVYSHHQIASFNLSKHIINLSGDVLPQPRPITKSNDGAITSASRMERVPALYQSVKNVQKL